MDRKYYGATDSVEVLMSVVGVIIGKIGGPQFACRIEAHGSCVRRRGDIHHTVNIDLYEQQTAIHTVTFASNMDMMPMVGAVSAFCASNEIEFLQSHGIQNLGKR